MWWKKEGDVPLRRFGAAAQWPPRPRTPWTGVVGGLPPPSVLPINTEGGKLRKGTEKGEKKKGTKDERDERTRERREQREEGKEEEGEAPPATAILPPRQQHRRRRQHRLDATLGNLLLPRFVSSCSAPTCICMQNMNNSHSTANCEGAGYCVCTQ
jgi:hypothetical protein